LEEPRQRPADEAALRPALRWIIGRLEEGATQVHAGLEEADWPRKRELMRALGQRVDVAHEQVHVVFRVEPLPATPSAEKKKLATV